MKLIGSKYMRIIVNRNYTIGVVIEYIQDN